MLGHSVIIDRKSLLALWGWPESEAESARFHARRVTKVGPEVNTGAEGWEPLNKVGEAHWARPDVSGGGERHDRFGVVVGAEMILSFQQSSFVVRHRGVWVARSWRQAYDSLVLVA
jgi:hypothetical protein